MKKKLVFDATILEQVLSCSGTGIYYTALNILKCLLACDQLKIILFFPENVQRADICEVLQKTLNKNFDVFPSINFFDREFLKFKVLEKKYRADRKLFRRSFIMAYLKMCKFLSKKISLSEIEKDGFDIYFSPIFALKKEIKAKKRYILLYDTTPLMFPEYFSSNIINWFNILKDSLNRNDQYFSISQSTKKDFLKYCPNINEKQIKVVPLAASEQFRRSSEEDIKKVKEKYRIKNKYIFSLCTLEPRKNLIRSVRTFVDFVKKNNIDNMVYVLGGATRDNFLGKLESELKLPEKIIQYLGYVPVEDLAALYSGAEWFVYTSQYEGFGLPPLEAMSCGCPVITSNNSSLPEVVGDAGIMIEWDSDEQHIKAYEDYYFNEKLRSEMARKGIERAQEFSWKKTADLIIEEFLK